MHGYKLLIMTEDLAGYNNLYLTFLEFSDLLAINSFEIEFGNEQSIMNL